MIRIKLITLLVALPFGVVPPVPADELRFQDCADCPLMQVIPPGAFDMGDETGAETDARPVHRVVIDRAFAIGVYEVTRGQFAGFVAESGYEPVGECNVYETGTWFVREDADWRNPGFEQGDNEPVVCITWEDARAYVNWLGELAGKPYRLPTEAEWEYVATLGGTRGPLDGVSHDTANLGAVECCGPRQLADDRWDYTAPAGSFAADDFGLHDVRGNVWEWLEDCYHENYEGAPDDGNARIDDCSVADRRVVRGGSYGDAVDYLSAVYRLRAPVTNGYFTLGFRVAQSLD